MLRFLQQWCQAVAPIMVLAVTSQEMEAAQTPHSLVHAFFSPSTARQIETNLGSSAAIDGAIMALGSPLDDIGGEDSGVVWIHDSATGALLHRLDNPHPSDQSYFGWSVAVSGSRVVVGVPEDNTGAGDAGVAYVYDLASATPAIPVMTLANPNPSTNDVFGWSVAISGTRVVVGTPDGDSGIADAGCVYVYEISSGTPTVPALQINNPDPAGKNFGHSVAVAGASVVVGSIQDSGSGDASRVHVYDVSSPTPTMPTLSLADGSPATNDQFGFVVGVSGSRVVVSAPLDDTGAVNAGVAYVYDLTQPDPSVPVVSLLNPAPAVNDSFGNSLSISGHRLLVGTSLDDLGATDSGMGYLFNLDSGTPALPAVTFANPGPQSGDEFGRAAGISGTRVIFTAPKDNTGANDAGSAYIYELTSGSPAVPVLTVNNPSPSSDEEFGNAVAISGNLVVVGSSKDDKGASNAGSVSLFDLSSAIPPQPFLVIDNPGPVVNDNFGNSVAASGSIVAVAVHQDDAGATNAGIVYIYNTSSATPGAAIHTILNPAPGSQDLFGNALAISGNLLVVGCFKNDTGAVDAGSVYVYNLSSPSPTVPILTIDNPEPGVEDWFGHSVAISGNIVVVGAHQDDTGASDAGSAYVFDLSSGTPGIPIRTLHNPSPAADDEFGYSVAVAGSKVVVGSRMDDAGAIDSGSAHVFDLNSATPIVPIAALSHPDPEPEEFFGISVAISGTRIVVGATEDDIVAYDGGCCYVYELTSATFPTPADRLETVNQSIGEWFGFSVAIDGVNILAGAPHHDGSTESRGAAYLFDPDPPAPEMQVEQPPGTGLIGGAASIHFGNAPVGLLGATQTVVIRNIGTSELEITGISIVGLSPGDFAVVTPALPATLQIDEDLFLDVSFSPEVTGTRIGTLRIESNAGDGSPFEITLTGQALSAADDTDGDGVNDVAELQMEAMGFNWQVNDEELVLILQSGANATGLFSGVQFESMNPGVPLLPKDPVTGQFRLKIAIEKSVDLIHFNLLPMQSIQTAINGVGGFVFEFTPSGPSAYFRLATD